MDQDSAALIRYDSATVGQAKRVNGFLRAPATIGVPGVQTYYFANGTSRRELVLPEELYSAESLDTLRMAVLTDNHPKERLITPENVKRYQVGQVGENTRTDNGLVVDLMITDSVAMGKVQRGKREVSAGYVCELEFTPGTYQGQLYDAIQRKRRYNHVAIVDVARAGAKARIHLDAADPVGISLYKDSPKMVEIKIDGIAIELEPTAAALVQASLDKRDQAAVKLSSDLAALTARVDGMTAELETERKARTDAQDPKHIAARVATRLDLERTAVKLLGAEVKLDSMDDRQIMVAVCEKHQPANADKFAKAEAAYLSAAYDFAVDALSKRATEESKTEVGKVRQEGAPEKKPDTEVKLDSAEMLRGVRDAFIKNQNTLKPLVQVGLPK